MVRGTEIYIFQLNLNRTITINQSLQLIAFLEITLKMILQLLVREEMMPFMLK